jgi:hypothetical protein
LEKGFKGSLKKGTVQVFVLREDSTSNTSPEGEFRTRGKSKKNLLTVLERMKNSYLSNRNPVMGPFPFRYLNPVSVGIVDVRIRNP